MSNYTKIQNLSLNEVAKQLSDAISTNFVGITDTNAIVIFRNGTTTVEFDWNEANKNFLTQRIKVWLESDDIIIKENKECATSQ